MNQRLNERGLPVGAAVDNWCPVPRPPKTIMDGQYCRLEPIDTGRHAADLFDAFREDREDRIWTYLPYGPFETVGEVEAWISRTCLGDDPVFYSIVDKADGRAAGVASYLRIAPAVGVIEVGNINYAPRLQQTPAATEAMFLMMRRTFTELGNRRYEWKCDALNARSMAAAKRLGFQYEGTFRQATLYKGRNRDTAWFSILDTEWDGLRAAFETWLDPDNFDDTGRQRQALSDLVDKT